jgi:hypothetical protein
LCFSISSLLDESLTRIVQELGAKRFIFSASTSSLSASAWKCWCTCFLKLNISWIPSKLFDVVDKPVSSSIKRLFASSLSTSESQFLDSGSDYLFLNTDSNRIPESQQFAPLQRSEPGSQIVPPFSWSHLQSHIMLSSSYFEFQHISTLWDIFFHAMSNQSETSGFVIEMLDLLILLYSCEDSHQSADTDDANDGATKALHKADAAIATTSTSSIDMPSADILFTVSRTQLFLQHLMQG